MITHEEYANAVVKLTTMALNHGGSGSAAAAQVLLSAYNGNNWQLDITDLCHLDHGNFAAAMTVIQGRKQLYTEPHQLINDGNETFHKLQMKWSHYHIDNRWKQECWTCSGTGKVWIDENDDSEETKTCYSCNGKGYREEIRTFPTEEMERAA